MMDIKEYILDRNIWLRWNVNALFGKNKVRSRVARHWDHYDSLFGRRLRSGKKFKGTEFDDSE